MLLLRSIVFQIYFFASVSIAAMSIFFLWPFPFKARSAIAKYWGKSMLGVGRAVCGLDYVIEGLENIPTVPSVIMIKHTTVFETYTQLAVFPPQTWVVKRSLQRIPFFGWGLAAMRPIAIDRGAGHTAVMQVIEQGRDRLSKGIWITIFPEGTRMPAGKTKTYGVSGAALAKDVRCPIVPVAHNAGDLWPRRGLKKNDPAERSPRETNLIVQDWVETKMKEISVFYK
jgi:1-acyl-sn-glycerol-3-phosphate acyltransferase